MAGVDVAQLVLKEPAEIYALLEHPPFEAPMKPAMITERGDG